MAAQPGAPRVTMQVEPPRHVRRDAIFNPAPVVRAEFDPSDPRLQQPGEILAFATLYHHRRAPASVAGGAGPLESFPMVRGVGMNREAPLAAEAVVAAASSTTRTDAHNHMDFAFPGIQVAESGTFHLLVSIQVVSWQVCGGLVIGEVRTDQFTVA